MPIPFHVQEFSPYAFRKLIDVLRLRKVFQLEEVCIPVRQHEKDDFNQMLSYLYPACEELISSSTE